MTDSNQPQRFCRQCGAEIRSGSSFCISCGAALTAPRSSSQSAVGESSFQRVGARTWAATQEVPSKAKEFWSRLDRRVKWGLLGILLIGLLLILSPIAKWISIVALIISILVLIVQAVRRESLKVWGISSASLLLSALVFSGIASVVYSDGFLGVSGASPNSADYDGTETAQDNMDSESQAYVTKTVSEQIEAMDLVFRQGEVHDFCVEACTGEHFAEMDDNIDRLAQLSEDAATATPPTEYEESHQYHTAGLEIAYDLAVRIYSRQVGSSEYRSLVGQMTGEFTQALETAPPSDQSFYERSFTEAGNESNY